MLLSLLAALASAPALADNTVDDDLNAGIEAQRAGRVEAAVDHYSSCLSKDPERVECHWEIGWSYWTRADWAAVVQHWETVDSLDPEHAEVDKWLPTARENLAQDKRLQAELLSAPASARRCRRARPCACGWSATS